MTNNLKDSPKSSVAPIASFLVALGAYWFLGYCLVPLYDIFGDAALEAQMAEDNWQLVQKIWNGDAYGNPHDLIVYNLEYYGTIFNAFAYGIQKIVLPNADVLDYSAHKLKQHLVWASALIDVIIVALCLRFLTRNNWMMLAAIALVGLQPMYFGSALNNIKDIPFSVSISIVSAVAAWSAARIVSAIKTHHTITASLLLSLTLWGAVAGLSVGVCASIRLGGMVVGVFWIAALLASMVTLRTSVNIRHVMLISISGLACASAAFLCVWALHPVAWHRPIGWMVETMLFHAHHPHPGVTLTNGEWISALQTPWYYLPQWLSAKIPVGFMITGLCGLFFAAQTYRASNSVFTRNLILTFALQLLLLPVIAIITEAHLYNGTRHFLMVHPALALFSGYGCYMLVRCARRTWVKTALCSIFALYGAFLTVESVSLHPFPVNYISELRRDEGLHTKWSMRYEGMSAIDWLHETGKLQSAPLVTNAIADHLMERYVVGRYGKIVDVHSLSFGPAPTDTPFWLIGFSRKKMPPELVDICEVKHEERLTFWQGDILLGKTYYCVP